ncbi:MAG: peptide-methionine (S)-S-oxide reductase MsrA [Nitrospirota bacterium]
MRFLLSITLLAIALGLFGYGSPKKDPAGSTPAPVSAADKPLATATFAGGCFWCMEPPFDKLPGVRSTVSGYTGGHVPNPTYEAVSQGTTGHVEAVQVVYDPDQISYKQLLDVFWRNVDPLSGDGQFCDRGPTYVSAIFYHDEEQRRLAEDSKKRLDGRFAQPIVTSIRPAVAFYPAEAYHQDYYQKNPIRYNFYRSRCGRDARLTTLWGTAPH